MRYLVDIDGTLLSSCLDEQYNSQVRSIGPDRALGWYRDLTRDGTPDMVIREGMVQYLAELKTQGHSLEVFTNRFPHQRNDTLRNLGRVVALFDSTDGFYSGRKFERVIREYERVVDNDPKYIKSKGLLVPTYQIK